MNDKEYEELRDRIKAIAKSWLEPLWLGWWHVEFVYDREGRTLQNDDGSDFVTYACCESKWQYATAIITFNMPELLTHSDEELADIVLHELCHILVCEMREYCPAEMPTERLMAGRMHEERVVTSLTKAFKSVRAFARRDAQGDTPREQFSATQQTSQDPEAVGSTTPMD